MTTSPKIALDFAEISRRLKALHLPPVDGVVGITTGGIVPASLLAHQLDLPLYWVRINYRDEDNHTRHATPVVVGDPTLPRKPSRLLLVDDVSVSGQTLDLAKQVLTGHTIVTVVMKGRADVVLFPEIAECVHWPWKP